MINILIKSYIELRYNKKKTTRRTKQTKKHIHTKKQSKNEISGAIY